MPNPQDDPNLEPVIVGGFVAAYRPVAGSSASKSSAKSAEKKKAASSAATAKEATK